MGPWKGGSRTPRWLLGSGPSRWGQRGQPACREARTRVRLAPGSWALGSAGQEREVRGVGRRLQGARVKRRRERMGQDARNEGARGNGWGVGRCNCAVSVCVDTGAEEGAPATQRKGGRFTQELGHS